MCGIITVGCVAWAAFSNAPGSLDAVTSVLLLLTAEIQLDLMLAIGNTVYLVLFCSLLTLRASNHDLLKYIWCPCGCDGELNLRSSVRLLMYNRFLVI